MRSVQHAKLNDERIQFLELQYTTYEMLQALEIIEMTKELNLQKYDPGGRTVHKQA